MKNHNNYNKNLVLMLIKIHKKTNNKIKIKSIKKIENIRNAVDLNLNLLGKDQFVIKTIHQKSKKLILKNKNQLS